MHTSPPPTPSGPRKSVRQHPAYAAVLLGVLVVLLGSMLYFVRSPEMDKLQALRTLLFAAPPEHSVSAPPEPTDAAVNGAPDGLTPDAQRAKGAAAAPTQLGNATAGAGSGAGARTQTATEPGSAQAVAALRQRLQDLEGSASTRPGADADMRVDPASSARTPGEADPDADGSDSAPRASYELPAYDREDMAARQRALEALRAQTMADLRAVSPTDAEALIAVMQRMAEGLRAQNLPNVIDMPKMEALLRGTQRINTLNGALLAEMGRSGGPRTEETTRLAAEMQALQASLPRTVHDSEMVERMLRGESP